MRISDWSSDVCSSDLLGLVVEAVDRDHRTEGLVPEAGHLLGDALEDGRLVEVETEVRARLAPGEDLGALGHGVPDVGGDGFELVLGDNRADVGGPLVAGAEAQRPGGIHDPPAAPEPRT